MVLELLAEKDIQVTWNSASVSLNFVRFQLLVFKISSDATQSKSSNSSTTDTHI